MSQPRVFDCRLNSAVRCVVTVEPDEVRIRFNVPAQPTASMELNLPPVMARRLANGLSAAVAETGKADSFYYTEKGKRMAVQRTHAAEICLAKGHRRPKPYGKPGEFPLYCTRCGLETA